MNIDAGELINALIRQRDAALNEAAQLQALSTMQAKRIQELESDNAENTEPSSE
jgi:hypothetical protein